MSLSSKKKVGKGWELCDGININFVFKLKSRWNQYAQAKKEND
jgi:hypothetical protein